MLETLRNFRKMQRTEISRRETECVFCRFRFVVVPTRCSHICPQCEIIFMGCPVCDNPNPNPNYTREEANVNGGDQVPPEPTREMLDQAGWNMLAEMQRKSEAEGLPVTPKPGPLPLYSHILRHCFIGVWDGMINCMAATLGIKSTKKSNVIAKSVNNAMLRIGRQTGRSVQPKVCENVSKNNAIKVIGGLAAVLISIHFILRKYGSK